VTGRRRGPDWWRAAVPEPEPENDQGEVYQMGLTAVERFAAQRYLEQRRLAQAWEPMWRSWMD
jgi:hypothetical protein